VDEDPSGAAAWLGAMIGSGRRAAGLTQQQLADQAGVSVGAVRDLEQGRTGRPRDATVNALALVLGLDVGQAAEATGWPIGNGHGPRSAPEPMTSGLWLRVLGPLAVWRNGNRADPGAGRQRAVLGMLAVHPGAALHRETIIDAVWGDQPPASAIAMVQSYASRLRRLLGETVLVSDGTSYRLALSATQLDALEFARLADLAKNAATAGNPATACRWYERALHLWRGEPLADVSALRGHPALTELAQLRTAIILDHADAAAAAGWPERVLPQLRELASRDPLDERAHARLMLNLAACGQQAAALSVFGQLRQRLDEELGITPGAELTDAHLRILRGQLPAHSRAEVTNGTGTPQHGETDRRDGAPEEGTPHPVTSDRLELPGPRVRAAGPPARTGARTVEQAAQAAPGLRQLPVAVAHFTGRAQELAVLTGLLDQLGDDSGTVVISAIGGMAGIGKTALAIHWAHQAAARFPDGQLYVNLRGFGPAGPPVTPTEALLGFLDALGVKPERIPAAVGDQAALYRSMIAGKRLLIVLDNARDEDQVRPLLPGSPGCLVIVTSRNELTGLAAAEGAGLLTLDLLTDTDARALLAARIGSARAAAEPDAAAEIASLCSRLPLALAITAARAVARPQFALAAIAAELRDAHGRLDALDAGAPVGGVRAVFSWSCRQLTPAASQMFRLLGLHPGPDISTPAAASLAGILPSQARGQLNELARAHLITEHLPGRYVLHDLLRAYAAEQAEATDDEAGRRDATGRVLDHYLHTAAPAVRLLIPAMEPVALAPPRPGAAAGQPADRRQALAWFEEEHHVLLAAVALAAESGFDTHAWQLPWAMTPVLRVRGHWQQWAATQRTALAAAARLGNAAGQALSGRLLAMACSDIGDHEQASDHYASSLALYQRLGDRLGQAKIHQNLSSLAQRQGCYADALGHAEQALLHYQAIGDKAAEAEALNSVGWCHAHLGDYQQARASCRLALALSAEIGYRWLEGCVWDSVGYAEHHLGNLAEAAGCYQRALSLLREFGVRLDEGTALTHLGDTRHAAGEPTQAREAWQQALAILDDLQHPDAEQVRAKLDHAEPG
jgi:DNA-binding SARP family transcriptional activator/tetratricopeptide (TPR) repeat protein/DNA-binding XRE family transcriptional regulator